MTSDQIKVLKETYMTESTKPNGNPGTEGEYMRFALDGGIDFVTSKDFVVFDDDNEMLHCVCINDHAISQADFPIKVISSEYAIVQQVETIMSIENFEKFLNSGFIANIASEEKKKFMLKWAKNNIRNQALQPMDSEPAYLDNTKVIPMPASKIEREDYVASTAYAKDANGNKVFFKTINDAFNNLEDGSTLYLTSGVALTEPVKLDAEKEITIDMSGHDITGNTSGKLFTVSDGILNIKNSGTRQSRIVHNDDIIYASSLESGKTPVVNIGENVYLHSDECCVLIKGTATVNSKAHMNSTGANTATIQGNGNKASAGSVVNIEGGNITNDKDAAIYFPQEGELNISNANIKGYTAIYAKSGKITITNSDIYGNGDQQDYKYFGNGENPTGDAIVLDFCEYPGGNPVANFSNSKIYSDHAKAIGVYDKEGNNDPESAKDNVKVGVGVFVSDAGCAKYCDENVKLTYSDTAFGKDYFITKEATPGFEMKKSDGTVVEVNTLAEAFANVEDGDIITVVDDEILGDTVVFDSGKDVTINMNGNNIYTTAATAINVMGSSLKLEGAGRIESDGIAIRANGMESDASLTIGEDVEIVSDSMPVVFAAGKATVDVAGTLETKTEYAVIQGNGKAAYAGTKITIREGASLISNGGIGIYHPQDGELEITGGTIVSDTAIYMKAGKLNISGNPIFRGVGPKSDYKYNNNGAHCTGDAIVLDFCDYPGGLPTATISGGVFKSENAKAIECYAKDGSTNPEGAKENVNISGGSFTTAPETDYIAEGYKTYHDNRTDLYSVVKA